MLTMNWAHGDERCIFSLVEAQLRATQEAIMFVISGVSGHTGAVAANTLLAAGKKVRVIVRDAQKGEAWRARGADVAVASLDDAGALATAIAGADGFYALVPPNY